MLFARIIVVACTTITSIIIIVTIIRLVFRRGGGIHQPEMRVSERWLRTQKQQCRFLRCTECCFCGGVFSEVPVQQEPDPDSNGSEAEQQQRDKNAGWDEGTCRQCGACYLRSSIRPALCLCELLTRKVVRRKPPRKPLMSRMYGIALHVYNELCMLQG